jgi:2'-hydroxyisoflavone reductase
MRILILGGSYYFGRTLIDQFVRHGHEVAVFNRGRSAVPLAAGVLQIHGQRDNDEDLRRLARSGRWDVVIDVSGKFPAIVERSVSALADAAERYVYVSTVEVYRDWPQAPVDEASPLWHGGDDDAPPVRAGHPDHGPSRAACEAACRASFHNDRLLIVRLHAMVGPYEYADPLLAWIERMRRGGAVLVPAPDRSIQTIDVRDAAGFINLQVVSGASGVFNVGAPVGNLSYGAMLRMCAEMAGLDVAQVTELVWADGDWLVQQGVAQWTELPLWSNAPAHWRVSVDRAVAAGLRCRSFAEALADIAHWMKTGGGSTHHKRLARFGMAPEQEAEIIARWRAARDRSC